MSKGVNLAVIMGNLGKDVEVKYLQNGTAVSTLRVAVNGSKKDGDAWVDHTEWLDVVVFGKNAENAGQYLSKGSGVHVTGRIQTRSYKDKDDVEKFRTEIVCDNLTFVGGGKDDGARSAAPKGDNKKADGAKKPAPPADGFVDDDLPF